MEEEIKYEMVVYWSDEDEAYVVEVPELPGCMADGRTYEEAIKNSGLRPISRQSVKLLYLKLTPFQN